MQGRNIVEATFLQKVVNEAVVRAGLTNNPTCHTFRHSFATHRMEDGDALSMVQDNSGMQR